MMIKFFTIVFIFACIISCSSEQQAPAFVISDQDYSDLRNIETVLWPRAYQEQDTVLLGEILHSKFLLVDDQGATYSRKDEIEYTSQYGVSYDSYAYKIEKLDILDNGTALIFGSGYIEGADADGAYKLSYKSSNVFVKEAGSWRVLSSHVSGVDEVRY